MKEQTYNSKGLMDYLSNLPKVEISKAIVDLKSENTILSDKIKSQENEIVELNESLTTWNAITGTDNWSDMSEVAKILDMGIGRNKIYAILRGLNILRYNNEPYQSYVDRGYFKQIAMDSYRNNGIHEIKHKTVVSPKGVDYIRKVIED